jgi:hypothetical protein
MPGLLNIRYGLLEESCDDSAKLDLGYRLPKILQEYCKNYCILCVFSTSLQSGERHTELLEVRLVGLLKSGVEPVNLLAADRFGSGSHWKKSLISISKTSAIFTRVFTVGLLLPRSTNEI